MRTKVDNFGECSNIPAGIFIGTEVFASGEVIYAIHGGQRMQFEELPSKEKRRFLDEYLMDKEGQRFIRDSFGIVGFESGFKKWLFCKFGSLDGDPDMVDGKVTPDVYNSACGRTDCPGRGKFCGVGAGLKGYEVDTLREVMAGRTMNEVADRLCVSVATVKSRMEKLKERHAVTNVVALAVMAAELGV
ncbi:response regulator transcription factor [Butyricimonas virosa]|jgi:DNA-binding CsgD family transcriptional regulator|uniref:response regulator transcription factor n=1 Tax=Butyricimonas virosa TaxID=544645 RepID=UPI00243115C4|nr:LuxR C-terminal-related transcriptional regulator [Butyricimonas virosa]MCI7295450.1 LuxR C-terminal-related transcriptional regulator [Butyricimonas virosa]MDY6218377.1 LuxR C-terminal-related transcriptional regulator [Butyricimonas virosa]